MTTTGSSEMLTSWHDADWPH